MNFVFKHVFRSQEILLCIYKYSKVLEKNL